MSEQAFSVVPLVPRGQCVYGSGDLAMTVQDHRTSDGRPVFWIVSGVPRFFDNWHALDAFEYLTMGRVRNDCRAGCVCRCLPKHARSAFIERVRAKRFAEYRARVSKNQPWSES